VTLFKKHVLLENNCSFYTELSLFDVVFVFVFEGLTRIYRARAVTERVIRYEVRGCSKRMEKRQSEELHDLY
jgi:hypothetical protein